MKTPHHITDKPIVIVFGNRPRGKGRNEDELDGLSARILQRLVEAKLPTYPSVTGQPMPSAR